MRDTWKIGIPHTQVNICHQREPFPKLWMRKIHWCVSCVLIIYCALLTGQSHAQISELYAKGIQARKLGLYNEAVSAFQGVLQLNPKYPEAYCELGAVYRLQDKTDDALNAYIQALELKASPETHGVAHLCLARIYHAQGRFADAEKHAQHAGTLLPETAEPFYRLGDTYLQSGQLSKAQQSYLQALKLDANLAQGYYGLGRIAFMQNCLKAAVQYYQRAIELAPYTAETHYNLALAYRRLKQVEKAKSLMANFQRMRAYQQYTNRYLRLLQEQPTALGPRIKLAEAHLEIGNRDAAIRAYQTATALHPNTPELYHNLGGLYMQNGQLSEAISAFQSVIQFDNTDAEAYLHLGWLHARQRKFTEATAYLQAAIQNNNTLTHAYYGLAEVYVQQEKPDRAIKIYRQLTAYRPADAQAWLRLGVLHLKLEQFDTAISAFERAIAADENSADAYNNLAWLYATRGEELPRAIALAERAVELDINASHLDTLAYAYYRQGAYAKAEQAILRAITLRPNNPDYQARLKEIQHAQEETEKQ